MPTESNKQVWDYLTYYIDLAHAPGFAVLVSGRWGVGKTYLLKDFLKVTFDEDAANYVYVSLYGLSSIEEIDDALFQAAFPVMTGTAAKVAGRIAKAGLKFLKVEPGDWNIKEFLNKFRAKVYVFDDLERCEAPINKVLGYINQFVEHGGAKVIILANEQEIGADEDYARRREKLIGKTLQVRSVFDEAFKHFVSNIDHAGARGFIEVAASDIATIYGQADLDNLRILQQTMWDFERFFAALLPEHTANKEAVTTLLRLLFVLSFEFKGARASEEDILTGRGMTAAIMDQFDKEAPRRPLAVAGERYPMVDIDDNVLSNELLVDYLVRGVVDADAIREELNASRFFVSVANEPAWRTVWHWYERSDAEFDAALAKMETQFKQRAFTIDGEILHVCGLRLFLADKGILKLSKADVVAECKQYVDDLYAAKKLETGAADDPREIRFQGWGGLGICESDTAEYKAIFKHLISTIQQSVVDSYPDRAKQLLSLMISEVDAFYRQVSLSHADASKYVRSPVLAKMPVDDFVNAYLALHPSEQRVVMMALKGRYEYGRLDQQLKEEKPWIVAVHAALTKRLQELSPISQRRVGMHLEWYDEIVKTSKELATPA
ncbi:KAP family NTPase [Bradyrhizobium quebecense]|uniref:KAP NTPase domain-containing protein n=1 Tax=Bradyrhizobium quebecense TaxID=2748629 RepID=A0A973WXS9_9BRAD|nr:P-loop NTPase fold protein [Bradyrhizobium quebecense]UGA43465.1 KAP family NTPase [Bradyrhizobium quebecense]